MGSGGGCEEGSEVAAAARQEAECEAARRAAEQMAEKQALEVALVAAAEATEYEAEARAATAGVWFRVEQGGVEHIRGPVWVGRVSSQVRWEGEAGRLDEWLAVEITVPAGREKLG